MAATTSARVITFSFSWPFAARSVSSRTNNSHARARTTGASAEIMRTSSSDFIIRLMRASGRSFCALKSASLVARKRSASSVCSRQNASRVT